MKFKLLLINANIHTTLFHITYLQTLQLVDSIGV